MTRARILVVDDEHDILTALGAFLEGALGVEVVRAESGKAALAALGKQPVDLVISDFRMPQMNGLEFLQQVQAKYPGIPRVMLTAFPDMELAIRALNETHIEQFLTKPVDPERLAAVAQKILERSRREKAGRAALERAAGFKGQPPGTP